MMNALKFGIAILSLAALRLAQDGLTIDNSTRRDDLLQKWRRFTPRHVSVVQREFDQGHPLHPQVGLVLGADRTRYGLWDEKSGLPSGTVTRSHRESCAGF
jgi:hypothetical protein